MTESRKSGEFAQANSGSSSRRLERLPLHLLWEYLFIYSMGSSSSILLVPLELVAELSAQLTEFRKRNSLDNSSSSFIINQLRLGSSYSSVRRANLLLFGYASSSASQFFFSHKRTESSSTPPASLHQLRLQIFYYSAAPPHQSAVRMKSQSQLKVEIQFKQKKRFSGFRRQKVGGEMGRCFLSL